MSTWIPYPDEPGHWVSYDPSRQKHFILYTFDRYRTKPTKLYVTDPPWYATPTPEDGGVWLKIERPQATP